LLGEGGNRRKKGGADGKTESKSDAVQRKFLLMRKIHSFKTTWRRGSCCLHESKKAQFCTIFGSNCKLLKWKELSL
jgi:hypothetical protein